MWLDYDLQVIKLNILLTVLANIGSTFYSDTKYAFGNISEPKTITFYETIGGPGCTTGGVSLGKIVKVDTIRIV